jgi:hypothetical protein
MMSLIEQKKARENPTKKGPDLLDPLYQCNVKKKYSIISDPESIV